MTNTPSSTHWDIFCTVVDNYGDIGVTWRLAKQMANEYRIPVNLWVDDLASFSHILPTLDPLKAVQSFNGVNILHWTKPLPIEFVAGEVLIEAFACELPEQVKAQLVFLHQNAPESVPIWLNLEYLSAEDWVEGCHGLPSLQANGLKKYFYFLALAQNRWAHLVSKICLPSAMLGKLTQLTNYSFLVS